MSRLLIPEIIRQLQKQAKQENTIKMGTLNIALSDKMSPEEIQQQFVKILRCPNTAFICISYETDLDIERWVIRYNIVTDDYTVYTIRYNIVTDDYTVYPKTKSVDVKSIDEAVSLIWDTITKMPKTPVNTTETKDEPEQMTDNIYEQLLTVKQSLDNARSHYDKDSATYDILDEISSEIDGVIDTIRPHQTEKDLLKQGIERYLTVCHKHKKDICNPSIDYEMTKQGMRAKAMLVNNTNGDTFYDIFYIDGIGELKIKDAKTNADIFDYASEFNWTREDVTYIRYGEWEDK